MMHPAFMGLCPRVPAIPAAFLAFALAGRAVAQTGPDAALGPAGSGLADRSPFLPAGVNGGQTESGTSYELRGIMPTHEGTQYYIYDLASKTGAWVGLNETGHPFEVSSADSKRDSVTLTLSDSGRIFLTLRESKTTALDAYPYPAAFASQVERGPIFDEQKDRLAKVMEDVARRRRLRAQTPLPGVSQPGQP